MVLGSLKKIPCISRLRGGELDTSTVISIFIPVFLTLCLAIGGVVAYRGSYYRSLPAQITYLTSELQRVSNENEVLRNIVFGKKELEEIIEILKDHDKEAEKRHEFATRTSDRQHAEILGNIIDIKNAQKRRIE